MPVAFNSITFIVWFLYIRTKTITVVQWEFKASCVYFFGYVFDCYGVSWVNINKKLNDRS